MTKPARTQRAASARATSRAGSSKAAPAARRSATASDDGLALRTQKRYGWRPDTPDIRDYLRATRPPKALPAQVSLRDQMPPVYDQGQLGSCTANAIGAVMEFNELRQKEPGACTPSRLFIYYNERAMEGTIRDDSGAEIRDGIKSVAQVGVPPETIWPYDISKFTRKPPRTAYRQALKEQALVYSRVNQDVTSLQSILAEGFPVVFGFTVYETFESQAVARTGVVPMPSPLEKTLGGHAVVGIGYKALHGGQLYFECRNSWSDGWGDDGYFWLPALYITNANLARDFWAIEQVE